MPRERTLARGPRLRPAIYSGDLGLGNELRVNVELVPTGHLGFLLMGTSIVSQPFVGGVLVPSVEARIGPFVFPPGPIGSTASLELSMPDVNLQGIDLILQWWFASTEPPRTFASTTAVVISG